MSLDRQIRQALRESADAVHVDVEESFDVVATASRRRRTRSRALAMGAAAAVLLGAAVVGQRIGGTNTQVASSAPSSSATDTGPVAGTFTIDIPPSATATRDALAGRWTISLTPEGVVAVSAPDAFTGQTDGGTYAVSGIRLRTNVFVNGLCVATQAANPVATYTWSAAPDGNLRFTTVADECTGRELLFTSTPWTRIG